jgi:hypothetical protein
MKDLTTRESNSHSIVAHAKKSVRLKRDKWMHRSAGNAGNAESADNAGNGDW